MLPRQVKAYKTIEVSSFWSTQQSVSNLLNWGWKQIQFPEVVFFSVLEYRPLGKVQRPTYSEYYTPPSEPFRIYENLRKQSKVHPGVVKFTVMRWIIHVAGIDVTRNVCTNFAGWRYSVKIQRIRRGIRIKWTYRGLVERFRITWKRTNMCIEVGFSISVFKTWVSLKEPQLVRNRKSHSLQIKYNLHTKYVADLTFNP
jgi:hypothetical protein